MAERGITILAGGLRQSQATASRAEGAGFDAVWSGEFLHRSAIVASAAMAATTQRIGIGTAIAYAVGRAPLVLANDARFLDEMTGGRFTLGLGTGTRRMMEHWLGVADSSSPALRMEELVPLLRQLWRLHEGPVHHKGRFYTLSVEPTADIEPPLRTDIPIYTAGVNPRMIEVAGRVADGLICHPTVTDRYLQDVALPAIERGARSAGRSASAVRVKGVVICAIAEDEKVARQEAAAQIAFYVAPKAYGPVMETSGFGTETRAVQAAFRQGDHQAMVAAVSDAMIDQMSVAGTPDQVRDQLPAMEKRYHHCALYSPGFMLTPERVAENTEAIIDTFGRS